MLIRSKLGGVVYQNPDDGEGGSSGGGGSDSNAATISELKTALENRDKSIADLQAKHDKLAADMKTISTKKKTKDAEEQGKLKDLLADTQAKLEDADKNRKELVSKLEAIDKDNRKKADDLFDTLPDAKKEELAIVRDHLDTDSWAKLVGKAVANSKADTPAPNIGQGNDKVRGDKKKYKPKHAEVISDRMGTDPDMPWVSQMEQVSLAGTEGFQLPTRTFIQKLRERSIDGYKVSPKKDS